MHVRALQKISMFEYCVSSMSLSCQNQCDTHCSPVSVSVSSNTAAAASYCKHECSLTSPIPTFPTPLFYEDTDHRLALLLP